MSPGELVEAALAALEAAAGVARAVGATERDIVARVTPAEADQVDAEVDALEEAKLRGAGRGTPFEP